MMIEKHITQTQIKSIIFRHIKKIVVLIVGGTVLLIGVALIVLPGPAFLVIPAGLAILAIEFAWARRLLKKARSMVTHDIPRHLSWKRWFKNRHGEEEKKITDNNK